MIGSLVRVVVFLLLQMLFLKGFAEKQFTYPVANNFFHIQDSNKWIAKPYIGYHTLLFDITPTKTSGATINYMPNVLTQMGVGFYYKGRGLSASFQVPATDFSHAQYGSTIYSSLWLSFYTSHFGVDFSYQHYKSFFVRNTPTIDSSYKTNDPYMVNSGLLLESFGSNLYYIHSAKFSFKSAFDQTERQEASAGSFLLMNSHLYLDISSPSGLIPQSQEQFFLNDKGFKNGNFYSFTLAPGYGYTWVTNKDWYFTFVGFLGGGIQHQSYTTANNSLNIQYSPTLKYDVRGSAVYNDKKVFSYMSFVVDNNDIRLKESRMNLMLIVLEIGFGIKL